jgi:hypothetical protein
MTWAESFPETLGAWVEAEVGDSLGVIKLFILLDPGGSHL